MRWVSKYEDWREAEDGRLPPACGRVIARTRRAGRGNDSRSLRCSERGGAYALPSLRRQERAARCARGQGGKSISKTKASRPRDNRRLVRPNIRMGKFRRVRLGATAIVSTHGAASRR